MKFVNNLKVGIAGCGGIGSNVAYHLVRSGVINLKFGDFDKIEKSNLNRQFFFYNQIGLYKSEELAKNLAEINPDGEYNFEIIKFTRENIKIFFKDVDIIVEAFDKKEEKIMLIEELLPTGKIIVSASGIGGSEVQKIKIKEISENFIIVGDFETDTDFYTTYSHKVNAVSCIMTEIILKKGGFYK